MKVIVTIDKTLSDELWGFTPDMSDETIIELLREDIDEVLDTATWTITRVDEEQS